jgi:hypothetical protein
MPRYFFVLYGPEDQIHNDPIGTGLADKAHAVDHAKRIVRELKEGGGYKGPAGRWSSPTPMAKRSHRCRSTIRSSSIEATSVSGLRLRRNVPCPLIQINVRRARSHNLNVPRGRRSEYLFGHFP